MQLYVLRNSCVMHGLETLTVVRALLNVKYSLLKSYTQHTVTLHR